MSPATFIVEEASVTAQLVKSVSKGGGHQSTAGYQNVGQEIKPHEFAQGTVS